MGNGKLLLRTTHDRLRSLHQVTGTRREALRCRLIIEVQVSRGLENRAETRAFHSADFFRNSNVSAEPEVSSRATLKTLHLFERQVRVKPKMISLK